MKLKLVLFFFIILGIVVNNLSYSQSLKKSDEKISKKIEELDKKVEQLESHITVLENKLNTEKIPKVNNDYSKGDFKKKENWRSLEIGMSKNQVEKLLGEPEKISKNNIGGEIEMWFYGYGHVTFDDKKTLQSWTEP